MKAVRSLSHRRSDDEREMDAAARAQTKRQKCVPPPCPVLCSAMHSAVQSSARGNESCQLPGAHGGMQL